MIFSSSTHHKVISFPFYQLPSPFGTPSFSSCSSCYSSSSRAPERHAQPEPAFRSVRFLAARETNHFHPLTTLFTTTLIVLTVPHRRMDPLVARHLPSGTPPPAPRCSAITIASASSEQRERERESDAGEMHSQTSQPFGRPASSQPQNSTNRKQRTERARSSDPRPAGQPATRAWSSLSGENEIPPTKDDAKPAVSQKTISFASPSFGDRRTRYPVIIENYPSRFARFARFDATLL